MIKLWQITKTELVKTSKIRIFWILFFVPILTMVPVFFITYFQLKEGYLIGENFWKIFVNYFFSIFSFLFPVVQSISANTLIEMEFKSNALQMLYTLPTKRHNIYYSKLLVHILWTLLFILFTFILILFSGTILLQLYPNTTFFELDLYFPVFLLSINIFLSCISIGTLHLFLSYCGISSQLSVLFASFASIISAFSSTWKLSYLNPYSWIFTFTKDFTIYGENTIFSKEFFLIVIYFFFFIIITLLVNKYKK